MKIGEVASASGSSVRQVRYYEKLGLIYAARGENGYREFPAETVLLVRRIGRMIALGFTTAEISTFLPCIVDDPSRVGECPKIAAAHKRKLGEIDRQIADLVRCRAKLRVTLSATAEPASLPKGGEPKQRRSRG